MIPTSNLRSDFKLIDCDRKKQKKSKKEEDIMIIGKVSYWDTKSRNLIVELDNGSLVRLTPEQISIYPLDKLDKDGIPCVVQRMLGKGISMLIDSEGNFSHSKLMMQDFSDLAIGNKVMAKVLRFSPLSVVLKYRSLNLFLPRKEVSLARFKSFDEYFHLGESIQVKVINKTTPSLYPVVSYRACFMEDLVNFQPHQLVVGKVLTPVVRNDGVFIEISPNVAGIMDCDNPKVFTYGEKVVCLVKKITPKGLRLSFSSRL